MTQNKIVSNTFSEGMFRDTHPSLQPVNSYYEAWNVIDETDQYGGYGVVNEQSTVLMTKMKDGYVIRGKHFIEERDQFVIFSYNLETKNSEIGILDIRKDEYTAFLNDSDLDCDLCFGDHEWIHIESKVIQPCNELKIYWSNNWHYRHLNLDKSPCDLTCEDLELFKCHCIPSLEVDVIDKGGVGLAAGAYQFVAQLEDEDGNVTNWFNISEPVYLGSANNKAGELSEEAIRIAISALSTEYNKVNIAVIKHIGGEITTEIITTQYYNINGIDFYYRGPTGEERDIDIREILIKNDGYIRGKDLIQHDNRLILYNTRGQINVDYQRTANEIDVEYEVYRVPMKYAHLFQGMRANEVYSLAIRWNYCDGTFTNWFHIPGREAEGADLEIVSPGDEDNCKLCEKPRWEAQNTAYRTELFCTDVYSDNEASSGVRFDWVGGDKKFVEEPTDNLGNLSMEDSKHEDLNRDIGNKDYADCICNYSKSMLALILAHLAANQGIGVFNSDADDIEFYLAMGIVRDLYNDICLYCVDGGDDPTGEGLGDDPNAGGNEKAPDQEEARCGDQCSSNSDCPDGCICEWADPRDSNGICVQDVLGKALEQGTPNIDTTDTHEEQAALRADNRCAGGNCGSPSVGGGASGVSGCEDCEAGGDASVVEWDPNKIGDTICANGRAWEPNNTFDREGGIAYVATGVTCDTPGRIHSYRGMHIQCRSVGGSCGSGGGSSCGGASSGSGSCGSGGGCSTPKGFATNSFSTTPALGSFDIANSLNNGRYAVMEFFGAWCEPCLDFKNSGILNQIVANYPGVDVVALEASQDAGVAEISGAGIGVGDFTSGVSYPVADIDDPINVMNQYNVNTFPSVVVVKPDGSYFNLGNTSYNAIAEILETGNSLEASQNNGCGAGGCGNGGSGGSGAGSNGTSGGASSGSCGSGGSCSGGECSDASGRSCGAPVGDSSCTWQWHYVENAIYVAEKPQGMAYSASSDESDCQPEIIYDEEGCEIIDIKPAKYSRGKMGYWESDETYPLTKDCNGGYIYGDLAGCPIRHHKMPSRTLEPHWISYSNGVPNAYDPGAHEWNKSYANFIGLRFTNIQPPTNTPKPLCSANPFTIGYVKRTDSNKSVIGSGMMIGTFKGQIHNNEYVVPKNGVNSLEYYDRYIEYGGNDKSRGGDTSSVPAYVWHSPDTEFNRPPVNADTALVELDIQGTGFRHGTVAEGEDPGSPFVAKPNARGARQAVNLNKFALPLGYEDIGNGGRIGKYHCIKGSSYVPEDSIVSKGEDFTHPLLNLKRESSVFFELKGNKQQLRDPIDPEAGVYNGKGPAEADGTSDASFLGDTLSHDCPIQHASAHYTTLIRTQPSQYGSVVNETYIPIGLEGSSEDLACNEISGLVGDSFIYYHTIKRTSYISDHIGDDISAPKLTGGITGIPIIGDLLKAILNTIGLEECGTVPLTREVGDKRNTNYALRQPGSMNGCWAGPGTGLPLRTSDSQYYPTVLSTLVTFFVESDVNIHYRQTGEALEGEVFYPKLKSLELDPAFPAGVPFDTTYMGRFYAHMEEPPRYKMILRVILNLIWTYGIGIWLIITGIHTMGSGGGVTGTIAAAIAGGIIILIGVLWIIAWANSNKDNKMIDSILGIKDCYPDIHPDRQRDGRVKGFEDNYYGYNYDFSLTNYISESLGLPDPYNTCPCLAEPTNKVIYSNQQVITSPTDAYRNFRVNNYLEIPAYSGPIQTMFDRSNRLYAHTTDSLWNLYTNHEELKLSDASTVYLGTGTYMRAAVNIFGGPEEGYAGTRDPNASENTAIGYIFIDREARTLNIYNNGGLEEISRYGMRNWFKENFYLKLLEQFPDYENVDEKSKGGVGYNLGYDHRHSRIMVTKIDYRAINPDELTLHEGQVFKVNSTGEIVTVFDERYFVNESVTLSFNYAKKKWISFHSYAPQTYLWDRNYLMAVNDDKFWRHNNNNKEHQVFYGEYYPMSIDFMISADNKMAFELKSQDIETDAAVYTDNNKQYNRKVTFNKYWIYNTYQSTGIINMVQKDGNDAAFTIEENQESTYVDKQLGYWRINRFVDRLNSNDDVIFIGNGWKSEPNEISHTSYNDSILFDKYFTQRFIFDNFDERDHELSLKYVNTLTNLKVE